MAMKINVLQVGHGDAIVVETCVGDDTFRILIDGGPANCFEDKKGPRKTPGALKTVLDGMVSRGEVFNLTILTHVDDDHIGGLLRACEDEKYRPIIFQDVWFNSGRIIAQSLKMEAPPESVIKINDRSHPLTSIAQGVDFDKLLQKYCKSPRQLRVVTGQKIKIKHGAITILSPTEDQLERLLVKWEKEEPGSLTSAGKRDYGCSLDELLKGDVFVEDVSVHNASSIAFLLEAGGAKALFLADALPSTICQSLHKLGYSAANPLEVSVCKLAHHGSKANTSSELLSLIRAEKFIVSTNGLRHGLPNKATIARISAASRCSNVLFNYSNVREMIFPDLRERECAVNMKDLVGELLI
jgi:beta-lactamase superfamily II metal-dependent hydrolase